MKSIQRRAVLQYGLGLVTIPGLADRSVWAQAAWPDKPVKFVLSQPAGAGPDIVARLIGDRLAKALGQPVVVDNKPGGQNVIGAQAAARSAPRSAGGGNTGRSSPADPSPSSPLAAAWGWRWGSSVRVACRVPVWVRVWVRVLSVPAAR